MTLHRHEIESWAIAYIKAQHLTDKEKLGSPFWWAIERFMDMHNQDDAEDSWNAILEILRKNPPETVIGILSAGPLEDLIEYWGPQFIDRIEIEARKNPDFRNLLGGVWESSTPDIWARVEKARVKSWRRPPALSTPMTME